MRRLVLLLALLALVAAGCGGESEEEKFVSEVNEICSDAEGEIGTLDGNEDLVRVLEKFISDLEAVDPPEDKKEDYDIWLTEQRQVADELKEAAETDDRERAQSVDTSVADSKSSEMGFDDCD